MDRGALVPDTVVIGLIPSEIRKPDCKNGYILDGFPRKIPQAEALDTMLKIRVDQVDRIRVFRDSGYELVSRLSGRRTCPKCGAMYHRGFGTALGSRVFVISAGRA